MRSAFGRTVITAAIGGAVALMAGSAAAFAATPPAHAVMLPPIVVIGTSHVVTRAEPHPEIMEAVHSLEHARDHLQHAAHDFGGHRVQAIAAIDAALRELHEAMRYDR